MKGSRAEVRSELTGLTCADVQLGRGANVRCLGKGRKERCTPLTTASVAVVRAWLRESGTDLSAPLFPTVRNSRLSSDAVQQLVIKHVQRAAAACPSLLTKHVTPHTLRHTAAMRLLHAGVDPVVIALWLGHERIETTNVYVHADITLKERALARTVPVAVKPGRYRAPDPLLAFLESL
jgi:site-specific recombinase XerD